MGWVIRPGGKRYYYRTWRVGKKTMHAYVGTGPDAEREAALDERRRAERRAERAAKKAELARLRQLEQEQALFVSLADLMAKMSLVAAGFRQHDRGEWTKRKVRPGGATDAPANERTRGRG